VRTPARVLGSRPDSVPPPLSEFFAAVAQDQGLRVLPDGVSVTFDLRGEGGGTWTVSNRDGTTEVARRADPYPDCLLRCEVADFQALLSGELDPRRGFLERRLAIEGDVGLVLRLLRSIG
jgi:putative sterol carrier protein